jgi:signal transduction histidine kinase
VILVELPTQSGDPDSQAAAYYILTETLANAQKHSGASSIRVRVSADGAGLHVVVEDNGVGGATETAGSGIMGMRQRVETFGGSFALESPAGVGTRVTAVIPARVS